MGLLDKFESRLENMVEGAAAKMFKGAVEPVELAAALQREATARRAVLGIDRVIAPNNYTVDLSEEDFDRLLSTYAETLPTELAGMVAEYLFNQHWVTYGDVVVELRSSDELTTGMFRVGSHATPAKPGVTPTVPRPPAVPAGAGAGGPAQPLFVVQVTGAEVPVLRGSMIVGRGSATDLDLVDGSVSRRHAEVRFDGEDATVADLGSTNGTMLNGARLARGERALITDGDVLQLGNVTLVFRQEGT